MTPNDEILECLAAFGYELPDNPDDVFWFMETSANQHPDPSVEFKWIEYNQIPLYFKNYRFMGMSVKGQYPHFLHRDVEKRIELQEKRDADREARKAAEKSGD